MQVRQDNRLNAMTAAAMSEGKPPWDKARHEREGEIRNRCFVENGRLVCADSVPQDKRGYWGIGLGSLVNYRHRLPVCAAAYRGEPAYSHAGGEQ